MALLDRRLVYGPFEYPQAQEYWLAQETAHWLHCVSADQRVVTNDGLISVQDLHECDSSLILFDGHKSIASSKMFHTAHRPVFRIHTVEGYTHTVTEDHRVMTNRGWVEAANLVTNDVLMLQNNSGLFGKVHDPDLAFLCGHFQGDGTSSNQGIIWQVWDHEYYLIPDLERRLATVYESKGWITARYDIPRFAKEQKNRSRRMVSYKCRELGLKKNVVPEFVWRGDKETVSSYLEGVLVTDGTVYQSHKHESIKLAQVDLAYLRDVQLLLLNLGVQSRIYTRAACDREMPDGNGGRKVYSCRPLHILEVTKGVSVARLNELTDIFTHRGKEFRGVKNPRKSHPLVGARFSHLESLGEQDVFCVSVFTENKKWVCNGFITHNTEIQMNSDIMDWDIRLSESEKSVIGRTLNGFVQTEVLIEDYWKVKVARYFKKPEIQAMAAAFANMETVHAAAYAYLQETLGLHDFDGFLHEPTAKAKIDRLVAARGKSNDDIALSLAVFSAFNEGVNLFSSFAILMSFSRRNMLKGVGKIIEFSIKDESLHSHAGCWLFRTFVGEYPEVLTEKLKDEVYDAARLTVKLEDEFIDQSFSLGDVDSISASDLKAYIRYRTNSKLKELGLQPLYKNLNKESVANLRWFDVFSAGLTSQDFFAGRVASYSKGIVDFSFVMNDEAWAE